MARKRRSTEKRTMNWAVIIILLWTLSFWFFAASGIASVFNKSANSVFTVSLGIFEVLTLVLVVGTVRMVLKFIREEANKEPATVS